ncbi:MAG: HAD-IA family hydrolase [Betaproteobacteria bacterium]
MRTKFASAESHRPAFIFDIDGTIIDSMPWHGRSWEAFLVRHGIVYEGETFLRATAGRTGTEIMRELFGPMSDDAAWALVHEKEDVYRELFAPAFREIQGFRVFAREARRDGIRIACATAGDAKNIAFALEGLGMAGEFDALAGAHDVRRGKPEPDLFLLAAARLGVDPADAIVFEDAPLGIEGARRAGMLAVAITSGEPAAKLSGPHVLATVADYRGLDPRQVLELARRHSARAPAEPTP